MARFVWTVALLVVFSVAQAESVTVKIGGKEKPPVPRWPERLIGDERLLLNNDGTNLFWRDDLSMEMVRRHAAECPDAVTTYLVCPNGIQKMMYPSEIEELSTRGALPRLVAEGHDPFGYFLTELKTRGFEVLVTFRMNEVHNVDKADEPDLSRFWREHPEWRVEPGAPTGNWMAQCMDYSRPEVQEYNTALICELLEKYRPDGVELDWMRFPRHLSGTPEEVWAKRGMLTDVVAAVRLKADELAGRLKRPVRVAVRIPSSPAGCRNLGVDLADWTARGLVDFVTAAPFLASDFAMPLEELRALMGEKKVPLYAGIEIGHSGKNHSEASLHAAGLGLLDSGADGLYLFNFPCWRESRQA
ncbi:MAG: family 10 glycosylhydrolase, partial [Candidatus Hydrogenedentes bacterium]|nr:family 10 glycosylhydrolase [Candidatus Hydrogenedentota bacterium]